MNYIIGAYLGNKNGKNGKGRVLKNCLQNTEDYSHQEDGKILA